LSQESNALNLLFDISGMCYGVVMSSNTQRIFQEMRNADEMRAALRQDSFASVQAAMQDVIRKVVEEPWFGRASYDGMNQMHERGFNQEVAEAMRANEQTSSVVTARDVYGYTEEQQAEVKRQDVYGHDMERDDRQEQRQESQEMER
jgi:hypothetical protein